MMFDERLFDEHVDRLIAEKEERKAEELMLEEYAALKAAGNAKDLNYVVFRLAYFYSVPGTENLEKAEEYFLESEVLMPGADSKRQTALFYFDVLEDFQKAIVKVDEIELTQADRGSYYSALTLKGQALIKLEMPDEAAKTLAEILGMIGTNPVGLPYGDEINLLEAAISRSSLAPQCREILEQIIPRIRSLEYQQKARALLK